MRTSFYFEGHQRLGDRIKLCRQFSVPPVIFNRILLTRQVPDKLPSSKMQTRNNLHSNNLNIMKLITHGKGRCCLSRMTVHKLIPHASAAFVVRLQNSFVHETLNFAEGSVVACVEEGCGFFCGEGLCEAACHDFINELLFAGAERVVCVGAAELDAADFCCEKLFAILDGVSQHL